MCSSKSKLGQPTDINGRPVLQPATSNRVLTRYPLKKNPSRPKPASIAPVPPPPISPKLKSLRQPAIKRDSNNQSDSINLSSERRLLTPPTICTTTKTVIPVKKSKKCVGTSTNPLVVKYSSAAIVDAPGSIAAATREHITAMKVQRIMKIAHYGRSKSSKYDSCSKLSSFLDPCTLINTTNINNNNVIEEKRCSFITPNSGILFICKR